MALGIFLRRSYINNQGRAFFSGDNESRFVDQIDVRAVLGTGRAEISNKQQKDKDVFRKIEFVMFNTCIMRG